MIRKILFLLVALSFNCAYAGSGGGIHLDKSPNDLHDKASLQRGMRNFMNYCSGCHSAGYMRYNRAAQDLQIFTNNSEVDESLMKSNLMFTSDKIGDTINSAMPADSAAKWFGVIPPDLTLVQRVRGSDWLYSYLRGFYNDEKRPFGVNNKIFPDVGMPNVLARLQGDRLPVFTNRTVGDKDHERTETILTGIKQGTPGLLTPAEFDGFVTDLVNYLEYMAEPAKLARYRLGVWVLLFLGILLVFTYLLKREFWRNIK